MVSIRFVAGSLKSVPQRPLMTLRLRIHLFMLRRTRRLLSASLIASAACTAHAAELGDPRVASHIGQQLVADIELTSLEDANTPVQVRLASPEVYSEAGIAVPSVLSTLNLSVMRRDGRQFLHATTLRPVDADHLHLYLELVDHGQREVRLATLWLTPDPHPAPAPALVPAVAPAVVAPSVLAPAVAAPAAPAAVARPRLRAPLPVPAPVHAHVEVEPAPPPLAWARPPVSVSVPAPAHAAPAVKIAPPLPVPKLAPLPIHAPARPAACAPQSGEAEACIALGAKNAELRARIGQLEQRVKGLQASLGAGPGGKPVAAPPAPAAATPAAKPPAQNAAKSAPPQAAAPKPAAPAQEIKPPPRPAGPMPISAIKPLVPHEHKTPPPDDDLPWGMIGGAAAVLAALGGAAALLRARGKRSRNVDIPDEPGMLPKLRERFFARNGGKAIIDPVSEPVAEPTLE